MKNSNHFRKSLHLTASLALAVAVMLATHAALAGGNGPVKGAALLKSADAAPVSTPAAAAMSCANCKDEAVTRTSTGKGHIQTSTVSQQHLCKACETKLVTTGVGKAARTEARHTCGNSAAGDASCCLAENTVKSAK